MISRRELIGKLAVASAVGLAAGTGRAVAATTRRVPGLPEPGCEESQEGKAPEHSGDAARAAGEVGQVPAGQPEQIADRAAAESAAPVPAAVPVSGPPPWDLLRPLALGSLVAQGWRVAELSAVEDGACVLTLRSEHGRSHRVHLCRNDGRPQGIVYSERFDLLVMNGGEGDLPTDEGLARAVAEVAHVLASNEAGRRQRPVVEALLPHAERVRRFAAVDGTRLR